MKSIDHYLARLSALGCAWTSSPGVWTDLCRAIARWAAQAQHPDAADKLVALWINRAPRFGAVAAHFPESLRKRRFVASFWAPELVLFGGWYRSGGTRYGLDLLMTQKVAVAVHRAGGVHCGRALPFWAPEVLLFGDHYLGWRFPLRGVTREQIDWLCAAQVRGSAGPRLPFWSPELPEVSVLYDEVGYLRPGVGWFRLFLLLHAFLLLLCLALPAGAQALFGTVTRITDGDTLTVGKAQIRLHGIDAPEGKQECHDSAGSYWCGAMALARLLELAPVGSSISCRVQDVDRYGRLVAICSVAQRAGSDLGREMVLAGWAVAYRRYSNRYVAEEIAAKNGKRGLWAGSFQQPEEWRKEVP